MKEYSKKFPYDKAVVLNLLYDALDIMAIKVKKANSVRGTVQVSFGVEPGNEFRIELTPSLSETDTLVQVFYQDTKEKSDEVVEALYDEMESIIKKIGLK